MIIKPVKKFRDIPRSGRPNYNMNYKHSIGVVRNLIHDDARPTIHHIKKYSDLFHGTVEK